jgi:hypothetical protein
MTGKKPLTWIDPETGLEWQIESPGQMNWYQARTYADSLSLSGREDWRLPTLKELESLLDRHKYRPMVREGVPFDDTLTYWSATTFGPDKENAWVVMFDGAYVLSYYKTNRYHIRCVRGTWR